MHYYKAFGICIQSDILLPQFTGSKSRKADVHIRTGDVTSFLPDNVEHDRAVQISENEILFFWEKIGMFLVRNGDEIIVAPDPEAEELILRLPLIGIVFAALLHQRGMLVLHASAVAIANEAVVFVGWKGAGKSTTSAMLSARGHSVVSDDIVGIRVSNDGSLWVVPGFPSFKLMPESIISIFGDNPETLSPVYLGAEKRFRSFADNAVKGDIPLKAIYELSDGESLQTTVLPPQKALIALIANTFLARYGKQLLQNSHAILNLQQCSNVINKVPVILIERPKDFEAIVNMADLIESQCKVNALAR